MLSPSLIAVVYGTRPEAIKLAPVVAALRARPNLTTFVVCTGQHTSLLANAEAAFTGAPDCDLKLMTPGQSLSGFTSRALSELDAVFARHSAAMVVAQGDTATAFAAVLAAFHRGIPTAHVEAGLRTYRLDAPFPEEGYRQLVDRLATRLYAPTDLAAENLRREGREGALVTGNTGIDACLQVARSELGRPAFTGKYVLATTHRREAFGGPMESICRAIRRIAVECRLPVVLPVHPNPSVRTVVERALAGAQDVHLIEPLPYPDLIATIQNAFCVLTDSGGIQEEAPTLGVPVLVTRETTERPEAVAIGASLLVGHNEDAIVAAVARLRSDDAFRAVMATPRTMFGDGRASERIADDIAAFVEMTKGST